MRQQKKICYISYEAFFTADKTVLPILAVNYEVIFYFIQSTPSIVTAEEIKYLASESDITIQIIKPEGRQRSPRQLSAYSRILKDVKAQDPDGIFITPAHNIYFALLSPFFFNKRKSVIAYHDVLPHLKETNMLKDLSQNIFKYFFNNFHFFSQTQLEIFSKTFSGRNYSYAPLIINEKGFKSFPLRRKQKTTHFLFFGNIRYYKGLDILIEAAEKLNKQGTSTFKVIIAGKGDHWQYCQTLIKTPVLFNQKIGFIDESEVAGLFTKADFIVLPYRDVTQSGPLALSHSYNLPAIASAHQGFVEHIVDTKNGYTFKDEDSDSLAEVMRIACELSEAQYDGLTKNLAAYSAELYNSEKVLSQYKAVFDNL